MPGRIDQLIAASRRFSLPYANNMYMLEESFVLKSLEQSAAKLGFLSMADYVSYLENNPNPLGQFIYSLHVTWSAFYRNPLTFAALEQCVLPALEHKAKKNSRNIRVWSAACAAGEEAYAMAILFSRGENTTPPSYRIFATDINEPGLILARQGTYSAESLANLPVKYARSCFSQKGNQYTILPEYKRFIDFSTFNLLSPHQSCPQSSIYGDFDLVFCANLLFYYREEFRQVILEKITGCLLRDGYLVTGDSEREIVKRHGFREIIPYTALYTKR